MIASLNLCFVDEVYSEAWAGHFEPLLTCGPTSHLCTSCLYGFLVAHCPPVVLWVASRVCGLGGGIVTLAGVWAWMLKELELGACALRHLPEGHGCFCPTLDGQLHKCTW